MDGKCSVSRWVLVISLLVAIALPQCLQAQTAAAPPPSPRDQALNAMRNGDFQGALKKIQEAIALAPANLDLQFVLGSIYIPLRRFEEAEGIFFALLEMDENRFRPAYFDLANIYAQQGKEDLVIEMLHKAEPVDPGRVEFELGLSYMRQHQFEKAVTHLERVPLKKPELEREATIQLALAYYQLKDYKKSKEMTKKALKEELPPQRAEELRRQLASSEEALYATKPWQVTASVGFQYNDNLFSNPLEAVGIGKGFPKPTDEGDVVNMTSVVGRYNFYRSDPWRFGTSYTQFFMTYVDHSELNVIGAKPSLYAQYERSPYFVNLEYFYQHFWANGEPDVQVHSLAPRFVMTHGSRWRSDLSTGIDWRYSKDIELDAKHYYGNFTESFLLLGGKAHVRGGYQLSYDDFVPDEQGDVTMHEFTLATQWPIWKQKWFVDVAGLYTLRDFGFDPNVSRSKCRDDNEMNVIVQVFGQLTPYMQLVFAFQNTWNDSNIVNNQGFDPYEYRRAVYTCMLTFNY